MTVPTLWERRLWEAESGRCRVCDGTNAGAVGARVTGVESGRHRVCDGADIVGVGAMKGRV